jgi:hypothetical protein
MIKKAWRKTSRRGLWTCGLALFGAIFVFSFQNMIFGPATTCSQPGELTFASGAAQFCDGSRYQSMKAWSLASCSTPGQLTVSGPTTTSGALNWAQAVVEFCDGTLFWSVVGPAIGTCSVSGTIAWNGTVPTFCLGGILYSSSTPQWLLQMVFQSQLGRSANSGEITSILAAIDVSVVGYPDILATIQQAVAANPTLVYSLDAIWTATGNGWSTQALSCKSGRVVVNGACLPPEPYPPANGVRIFVSTTGNDSNSGTYYSPFATVEHARDYVRTLSKTSDIYVAILKGTYTISSPILFDERDSGANGFHVIYQSIDGPDAAKLVGGTPITGWTQYSGNIYRAPIGFTPQELFENGVRAVTARTPNINGGWGVSTTGQGPWLKNLSYNNSSNTQFRYSPSDFNPSGLNTSSLQVVIYPGGWYNWQIEIHPVASIDASNQIITLTYGTGYALGPGSRFFLQNDLSFLDAPGEFFVGGGYVYYYSRVGSPNSQSIIAPTIPTILRLSGSSPSAPVSDVIFDGLGLAVTDFSGTGMITMNNTLRVTVKNSHLKNVGYDGIEMNGFNKSNVIYGNYIENVGVTGIIATGDTSYVVGAAQDENRDHTIENNRIEFVGLRLGTAGGIRLENAGHCEISYNLIQHSPRWLIEGGATVDIDPSTDFYVGNHFAYNYLTNSTEDSADAGAFYSWGAVPSPGNVIEQMIVDNTNWDPNSNLHAQFPLTDTNDYNEPTFGVYFDDQSAYFTARNIVVLNAAYAYLNNGLSESLQNVSWQAGFDNSQIDYNNIGLRSDFPASYK